jgi:probable F420-dependent oxidoreductase
MFQVHATIPERMPLAEVAAAARRAEALGYDGINVPEAVHDGLLAAGAALAATSRIHVATSVLVAFPRSPMAVAHAAWDLQQASGGRFQLGLGSQVRGNIVRRYSVPWTAPVPRMREYVLSLRAIFDCWQNDAPLEFEGEHYQFTRMQPFFNPGPIEHPELPIFLGGVGPYMTALAGEVSDGLVTHPTNSAPRYLREVIRPRVEKGAARSGRKPEEVALQLSPLVATGATQEEALAERERWRELLTFLYSTPSYWPSLELFGWKERGEKLNALTREGKWQEMGGVVDDEMLETFAPMATYTQVADLMREWWGGLATQITFPVPADPKQDGAVSEVVAALRAP